MEILPHTSWAVQVLFTLYDPPHAPSVVTFTNVKVNELPQASLAVGVVNTGFAGQLIVLGAGNAVITGAVLSNTLIVCEAVVVLPQRSVAVHVRLIVYELGHEPGVVTSANVKLEEPHASVAVGIVNVGVAGQFTILGAGSAEMTGPVTSCTVIVWDAVEELPHASVAVQVLFTL